MVLKIEKLKNTKKYEAPVYKSKYLLDALQKIINSQLTSHHEELLTQ